MFLNFEVFFAPAIAGQVVPFMGWILIDKN